MTETTNPSADSSGKSAKVAGPPRVKTGTKKKKKKKSRAPKVSLSTRLGNFAFEVGAQITEIYRSLRSPDRPTRRMSRFFFVSLVGVLIVGLASFQHFTRGRSQARLEVSKSPENSGEKSHHETNAVDAHTKNRMLDVGAFTIELKPNPERKTKYVSGMANMAEVTLVLECDSAEAYSYLELHLVQVRNQITNVLVQLEREELLTPDGKRRLKLKLLDAVNAWLSRGKVKNIFFSKLVVA